MAKVVVMVKKKVEAEEPIVLPPHFFFSLLEGHACRRMTIAKVVDRPHPRAKIMRERK